MGIMIPTLFFMLSTLTTNSLYLTSVRSTAGIAIDLKHEGKGPSA